MRRLVGLPYMIKGTQLPAEPASSLEDVVALLKKTNITGLVIASYIIPAFALWPMVFKPF